MIKEDTFKDIDLSKELDIREISDDVVNGKQEKSKYRFRKISDLVNENPIIGWCVVASIVVLLVVVLLFAFFGSGRSYKEKVIPSMPVAEWKL